MFVYFVNIILHNFIKSLEVLFLLIYCFKISLLYKRTCMYYYHYDTTFCTIYKVYKLYLVATLSVASNTTSYVC